MVYAQNGPAVRAMAVVKASHERMRTGCDKVTNEMTESRENFVYDTAC